MSEPYNNEPDWFFDDEDGEDEFSELEEALGECGRGQGYDGCMNAGSEYCDFECLFKLWELRLMKRGTFKKKWRKPLLYNTPRAGSRRELKAHLDRLSSRLTLKDGNPCFVCGESDEQLIIAGHVFSRTFPAARFDLENLVPLCSACNLRHEDQPHHLIDKYIKAYGRRAYDQLEARHWDARRRTDVELAALATEYEGMLGMEIAA